MSKDSINLNKVFKEIFEVVSDLSVSISPFDYKIPDESNCFTISSGKTTSPITECVTYNSSGQYWIGDTPYLQKQTVDWYPWVTHQPKLIWIDIIDKWIDIIDKTDYSDLKSSVPKYPVSNFSIDKDGTSLIEIAVSGFSLDEITVERNDTKLEVKGKRKDKEDDNEKKYLYKNIACRDFELSYDVSDKWDFDKIDIVLKKGILTIKIPLLEECKPIKKAFKIRE